jgi:polyhydroxyalkanoate synthesis regulator phasin
MLDSLKKALYAGVGLAFLTRDKIEELGKRLAEEAKLSEPEGRKLVDEFLKKGEDARASLEKMVSGAVNAALERIDIPKRSDLKALEARVQALEAQSAAKG